MIAIMISIKPYWYAKILNGEKGIEVRKNKALAKAIQKLINTQGYAPILGYCTKDRIPLYYDVPIKRWNYCKGYQPNVEGKVVACFYCDKVDEWDIWQDDLDEKIKLACLSIKEFDDYSRGQVAYAIHISQLEIFDKPKELDDFVRWYPYYKRPYERITKAPQNFCYVEVE